MTPKKIKLVFLSILVVVFFSKFELLSQSSKGNYNYLDFQQKPYYFGITLGYNTSNYNLFRSKEFLGNDSIRTIESVRGPGFNLGIITNLKIGEYFDLRFLPTLSFAERKLEFTSTAREDNMKQRSIESVFVEMPFHARYKSKPFHDIRMFVIGGVKYSFDVASDSRSRTKDLLVKVAPSDFSAEVGVGAQFFFPFFIFSPEFKFSYGLGNSLIFNENLIESTIIEKITSRTYTISFHFEG